MELDFPEVEGFVLAGGLSSRMGQDKARLSVAGHTLLESALAKLRALALQGTPRIAGARPDLASFAPVTPDLHPGFGPLSGIEAALFASRQPLNLFLPVDMPLLPPEYLRWMLERARITGARATVPRSGGVPQPLCALYHRELLEPVSAAIAAGQYKVMPVIAAAAGRELDLFDIESVVASQQVSSTLSQLPVHLWFLNCNTRGDMAVAEDALVLMRRRVSS
jgi:molybdenum cofactor guanylyltransferase